MTYTYKSGKVNLTKIRDIEHLLTKHQDMKINICGIGDPIDPKVWSGTPYNIYMELLKTGNLASAFSSDKRRFLTGIFKLTGSRYYDLPFHWERRGPIVRALNAYESYKETKKSISQHTLHFGTGDLPFKVLPKHQQHYIYCDSTWDLWYNNTTNRHLYSDRIVKVSERLDGISYRQAAQIFTTSQYVRTNLIEHYQINPEKISVVGTGQGIIQPFFGEKDYSNGKILFVAKGRFEDKGGPLVINAFLEALNHNPNLQLTIVGQEEYKSQIKHPNITTHGFVSFEALQGLFNSHSLFLMPAFNEPWGLVYIEAMLCKMPIIGFNKNSFPELSNHGKFGASINKEDAQELAHIILSLLSDPLRLAEIGLKAQKYAQQFTWANTVTKILRQIHGQNKLSHHV